MTTTQERHEARTSAPVAGWRVIFDKLELIGAIIGAVLCALQVAFAAYGFWIVATGAGGEAAGREAFGMHVMNGTVLSYLAVALLICGLLARAGWKGWVIPLVIAVLLFAVQGPLVGLGFGVSPWFGALHAFDGMIVTAGFVWLLVDRAAHPLHAR
ncbi:hypothetical protein [Microbacterium sp.]|uniref:hypothetical protein n=1 Tax=Microbacterium sp. TaxID=51671 RepID=UPI003A953B4A